MKSALVCAIALAAFLAGLAAYRVAQDRARRTSTFARRSRRSCAGAACPAIRAVKSRGGLDLSTRATALAGGDEGPAIVPGDAKKSLLLQDGAAGRRRRCRDGARPAVRAGGHRPRPLDRRRRPVAGGHRAGQAGGERVGRGVVVAATAPSPAAAGSEQWGLGEDGRSTRFILAKLESKGLRPSTAGRPRARSSAASRSTCTACRRRRRRSTPSSTTPSPTPTRGWSTGCWPRRATASAGGGTGSTSSTTPTRTATTRTSARPSPGRIATTSSARFNDDMPYRRFVREQLAGDVLLPGRPGRRHRHRLRRRRAVGLRRPRRAARGDGRQGEDAPARPRRHGGQHHRRRSRA